MRDLALVVMARAPELGRVKTRLAAGIGARRALLIYRSLLAITARAAASWAGPVLLATTGDAAAFQGTGLEGLPRREQFAGTLGERIGAALTCGFELAPRSLVIGSDCPGLCTADLRAVGRLLDAAPVAFGPAADGGFWAIGTGHPGVADVIARTEVAWSTPATLTAVRARLATLGVASRLGPMRTDCDTAGDLDCAIGAGLLALPWSEEPES